MKGTAIADALSVNPLAEFALRPRPDAIKAVRVRGLEQTRTPGTWLCKESTHPLLGGWLNPGDVFAHSRDLCTVEDAERQVKERIDRNAAQFAANAKLDRIVATLQGQGVEARRALGGVLVRDTAALGRLLARLP
jgi:hypothetical protein